MISIKFIIFVVMVILIKGASSSEKVWNQFRGPSGQGHAMDILPMAWSWEGKNLLWRTEIEGKSLVLSNFCWKRNHYFKCQSREWK